MTNLAQVGHVMRKDLREFRWLLAAYLCVVALATGHALRLKGLEGTGAGYLMVLVVAVGMIVAASVVQGDSPVRADAFWATHPLNPGAVLLAKFALVAIVVISVPAIGELAGLMTYGIRARDLPAAVATSIWEYGRWLLIAMTIGALARDLKAVVIALICIPVYFVLTLIWFSIGARDAVRANPSAGFTMPVTVWVVAFIAGGAGLLWYEYRSRDARPRTWFAGVAVFFAGIASLGASGPSATSRDVPASVPRTTVRIALPPHGSLGRIEGGEGSAPLKIGTRNGESLSHFPIRLEADSMPPSQRLTLIGGVAIFRLRDGSVLRAQIERQMFPPSMQSSAVRGMRWRGEGDGMSTSIASSVGVSDSVKKALDSGLNEISVEARLAVSVPDYADTLPLTTGATMVRNRSRVTINNLSDGAGGTIVTLDVFAIVSSIEADGAGPFNAAESTVSLVNDVRHEAIAMESEGSGYETGWLVLPGNPTRAGHESWASPRHYPRSVTPGEVPVDDAWLRDARLVVTHWKQIGSYPVTAKLTVP